MVHPPRLLLVILVGLACTGLSCTSSPDAPGATSEAEPTRWSDPEVATATVPGKAKWPSLFVHDGTVVVAATQVPTGSYVPQEIALVQRREDGTWAGGGFVSQTPSISRWPVLAASPDTLHILWGERRTSAEGPDFPTHLMHRARPWDASGDTTEGSKNWTAASTPFGLIPAALDNGRLYARTRPVVDAKGRLTMAVGVLGDPSDDRPEGVWTMQRTAAGWAEPVPLERGAAPSLAGSDTNGIALTYLVDVARDTVMHENSIAVRTSEDGTDWSERRIVHYSGGQKGQQPVAMWQEGRLHVVWRVSRDADSATECVLHTTWHPDDAPRTPEAETTQLCPPDGGAVFDTGLAATPDGRVHLVFSWQPRFAAPVGRLYHATWDAGTWSAPQHVPQTIHSALQLDLQSDTEGRLHLAWTRINGPQVQVRYARTEPDAAEGK